jgi:GTP pyrophosphokinase
VEAAEVAQASAKAARHYDSKDDILVLNAKDVKGIDYKMAKCCNPVFGDDVFGFVTREAGIKIHRITCPNAARLLELYPYRIQKVKWADTPSSGSFQVALKIITDLESSVLNKVMEVVGQFKASIRSFNVNENQRAGTYEISMKLSVPSNLELDKVLSQLRIQKHVIKVSRV